MSLEDPKMRLVTKGQRTKGRSLILFTHHFLKENSIPFMCLKYKYRILFPQSIPLIINSINPYSLPKSKLVSELVALSILNLIPMYRYAIIKTPSHSRFPYRRFFFFRSFLFESKCKIWHAPKLQFFWVCFIATIFYEKVK